MLSRLATALPVLLLLAFVLFVWLLFGQRFLPSREVELVSVVTQRASIGIQAEPGRTGSGGADLFEATPLFQASGWIEPDPLPIRATALYGGIVSTVEVLEGEAVEKGQLLATLIDEDAVLDLQTARAVLGGHQAELSTARATARETRASLQTLRLQIEASAARLEELRDESDRLERARSGVFPEREVVQATLRLRTQQVQVEALRARRAELTATLDSRQAGVERVRHTVEQARTDVARKQLALDRTRIYSPVEGIIQELYAAPGMKRIIGMDDLDSATVAKLYQPSALQARIDVPLEEAARLAIGQPVRLRSSLFPNRVFKGRVTRLEGQADLQRNTLQAKVALLDPDTKLRPEMLCRAEFLPRGGAAAVSAAGRASDGRVAIFVPEDALLGEGDALAVWVLDRSGERVTRRIVRLGRERRGGFVRVAEGLNPGDQVVVDPPVDLKEGERVQ